MADLATAYVKLVPSLKGAQKTIQSELDGVDTSSSGKKMGGKVVNGLKSGIGAGKVALGNMIANAVTSAASTAANAAKSVIAGAFNNFADYEQLTGGIEKLYGESAAKMLQYADNAYMTMGKSKNQYMQQVTSFSAALINDLGGDTSAAADRANLAMTAIADNVSIFGSNVEDVQNAFQGFAKQNYTMLDNLKLGYGGTKSEMERLIADANEYAASIGQASNLSIDSFADVVTAIDLIQQKQGIAGNAATEAMHTISGSIAMTQAAWQNFLTVLGDPNGDIPTAVTNLVESASSTAQLIIPKITEIMSNLAIALPQMVDEMLPILEEHSTEMIDSLADVIAALLPVILEAALILFMGILAALVKSIPGLLSAMGELVLKLVEALALGLEPIMRAMEENMVGALNAIGSFFMDMWNAGGELISNLINGIVAWISFVPTYISQWINAAVQTVVGFASSMWNAGANIIQGLVNGIASNFQAVIDTILGGLQNAVDSALSFLGIHSPSKLFAGMGENTMLGLAKGIDSASGEVEKTMQNVMSDVYGAADGVASVSMRAEATGAGSMAAEVASLREELRQMRLVLAIDGRAFAEATVGEIDRAMGAASRRAAAL